MSDLKYYAYPGLGEWARDNFAYSQSVRVGDRIEVSAQGGWVWTEGGRPSIPNTLKEEIDQAFKNVETALKDAGGKGWSQVYRVNTYHLELSRELMDAMKEAFEKWMPDHKPLWTHTGAAKLGAPGMNVKVEVVAYAPEGAN